MMSRSTHSKAVLLSVLGLVAALILVGAAGAEGAINPVISKTRSSGTAPLAVWFDGISTTGLADGDYVNAYFNWDFDSTNVDGSPPEYVETSGFVASYVFTEPGTYTVTMDMIDKEGNTASTSTQITVSAFSGTTYYVAANGDDSNNGTSTGTPWKSVSKAFSNAGANKRVLFKRGDSWSFSNVNVSGKNGPCIIGAYGSGARPLLNTSTDTTVFKFGDTHDWRVCDLHVDVGSASGATVFHGSASSSDLLFKDIEVEGYTGIGFHPADPPATDGFFVFGCYIHDCYRYGVYGSSNKFAFVDCKIENLNGGEHGIRIASGDRAYIAYSNIRTGTDCKTAIQLRGKHGGGSTNTNGLVLRNRLDRICGFCPQNDHSEEWISYCVADGNLMVPAQSGAFSANFCSLSAVGHHIVFRNNRMYNQNRGILAGGHALLPGIPHHIWAYNNTYYNDSQDGREHKVVGGGGFVEVKNNMYYANDPSTKPRVIDVNSSAVCDNNLFYNSYDPSGWKPLHAGGTEYDLDGWQATGRGLNTTQEDPIFVSTNDQSDDFLKLSSNSPAIDAGAVVPCRQDCDGMERPQGLGYDKGAWEYESGTGTYDVDGDNSSVGATSPHDADGSDSSTITVTCKDASNDPIADIPASKITVYATGSGNTVTQPAAATDANGQTTASLTSTGAGTKTVSVVADNVSITDTASVVFEPGSVSASKSQVDATSPHQPDGSDASTITITARDAYGNPIPDIGASNVTVAATGTGNSITQPTSATDANGQTTATMTSTAAENKTVSATINAVSVTDTANVTFGTTPTALHVDDDYTDQTQGWQSTHFDSIQDAIDAAVDGTCETITVYAGTYTENIDLKGKGLTLTNEDPEDATKVSGTIIDGGSSGTVVTFNTNESSTTALEGFTVQNGSATDGAGILCVGASPAISNCVIKSNTAGSTGGGILAKTASSPTFTNCLIYDNAANGWGGGGIRVQDAGSDPLIENCTIVDNSADTTGEGMAGGFYSRSYASPTLINCVLWGNTADVGGDQIGLAGDYAELTVSYCDVEGGQTGVYTNSTSILTWGSGNISTSPAFVDAANDDFHLGSSSPCIDAADGDEAPAKDMEGNTRVDDASTANTGAGTPNYTDIGPYEYQGGAGDNHAPVANDDSYSTDEDTQKQVSSPGVLDNDTDEDSDSLTAIPVTDVSHGTLTLNSDGSFTYDADANWNGADSFTYRASDGQAYSATATVTITVNAVNDAPTASADSYGTDKNEQLIVSAPGVLDNDGDVDGDGLTASLDTDVSDGTLSLSSDGSFTYTPDTDYTGDDSFTYKAYDGTAYSSAATVSLTVSATNTAPSATDDSYNTDEDTDLNVSASGVLSNDTDADEDSLTAVLDTDVSHGSLTLNSNGSFTYDPDADYNGSDSFTYKAYDGQAYSTAATVSLTVNAVNDAPVASDDSYDTDKDTDLNVSAPGVLTNDTDVEDDSLSAVLVTDVSNGSLTLNSNGSFDYTPDTGYTGDDTFTYKANDGTADSGNATVTITVSEGTAADIYVDDDYNTNTSGWQTTHFDSIDDGIDAASSGDTVLVYAGTYAEGINFDGKDLTVVSDAGAGSTTIDPASGTGVTFSNSESSSAVLDGFSVTGCPGRGIYVNGASPTIRNCIIHNNDTATDDDGAGIFATGSGSDVTVESCVIYENDADDDGGGAACKGSATLTLTNCTIADNYCTDDGGGVYSYYGTTLNLENCILWDNSAGSVGDQGCLQVSATCNVDYSDVEGGQNGIYNGNSTLNWGSGNINFTPGFTDQSNDDYSIGSGSPCIDAADGGDAPETDILGNSRDDDGSTTNTGTGTPDYADIGAYEYGGSPPAGNNAPVANNDSYSTNEDTQKQVSAPGVLSNDTDADEDSLTAGLVSDVSHGTLNLNSNGSFTYTPDSNWNGQDSFTYKANDGTDDSANATVTLTVNAVNDAPVATADSYSTDEDTQRQVSSPGVLDNDTDAESDSLTATLMSDVAHGTLTLNSDGSFTYDPDADWNGSDSFTYKASDGSADSNTATVSLTVNAVNDAPTANDDAYDAQTNVELSVDPLGVLDNDTDVDDDSLTATLVTNVSDGTLSLSSDGSFTYTSDAQFTGDDSFTYKANDGTADSGNATVTITVTDVYPAAIYIDDDYTSQTDGWNYDHFDTIQEGLDVAVNGTTTTITVYAGTYAENLDFADKTVTLQSEDPDDPTKVAATVMDGNSAGTVVTFDGMETSTSVLKGFTIQNGSADDGAGIVCNGTSPKIENCVITANTAGKTGAGILVKAGASPGVTNCLIYGNTANGWGGGAMRIQDANTAPTITNCTIADNSCPTANQGMGGGLNIREYASPTVVNCVLWDNTASYQGNEIAMGGTEGALDISYSDVEGGESGVYTNATSNLTWGSGNLDSDPDFVDSANDDYAITTDSPCIDAADGGEAPANDLKGDGRYDHPDVSDTGTGTPTYADIGAYEYQVTNQAPTASNDSYQTDEDNELNVSAPGVLDNDSDPDDDTLTATKVSDPSHGSLTLNSNGSFDYTPDADYNGSDSFTYEANDGTEDSNTATVSITVNSVNDAPVASDDSYSTDEDTELNVSAPGVLDNDTDTEGDSLTASKVSDPSHGSLTLNSNGSFDYTPDTGYTGDDSFTYKANDGTADSNTATVTITVNPDNQAPTASNDSYSTDEDDELDVSAPGVLSNDTDPDEDTLTATKVSDPSHGSLMFYSNGSFSYAPTTDYNGDDSFSYKANDGTADSNNATVSLTVDAVNDAPTASDDSYSTDKNTELNVGSPGVLSNDSDVEDDSLTASKVADPSHGSLTLNSNGSFDYDPDTDYTGDDTFTYKANDGTADSGNATVTVSVTEEADIFVDDDYDSGTSGWQTTHFDSIDDGIDAASSSDTVLVYAGTYAEGINFDGKDLTVVSDAGPASTTIDPATGAGVTFSNSESSSAVLDGFTVTGCPGRGIYVSGASPTIRNCIIHNNATATGDDGAGIFVTDSDVTVESCVIYENDADDDGGGTACKGGSTLTLTNCTIADNYCTDDGGGVYSFGSTLNLENCILWDNSSGSVGGQGCLQVSATCNVDYCDVEDGQNGIYNGNSTLNWGSGNINSTPSFSDQSNDDYSIGSGSPCIDAADGGEAPETDILGNNREDDGSTTNTGTGTPAYADIGAYEYQP